MKLKRQTFSFNDGAWVENAGCVVEERESGKRLVSISRTKVKKATLGLKNCPSRCWFRHLWINLPLKLGLSWQLVFPFPLWRARAEDWRGISDVWLKLLKPAEHSGASVENHFIKKSPTDRLHGPEMLELKWHNKCLFRARSSLLDWNIYTMPGIYSQSRNQTLAHRSIINVFDTKKILRLWFFL